LLFSALTFLRDLANSMEIGSAYALQVCLIQAPAMLAFSAFYAIGKESLLHHAFTCGDKFGPAILPLAR